MQTLESAPRQAEMWASCRLKLFEDRLKGSPRTASCSQDTSWKLQALHSSVFKQLSIQALCVIAALHPSTSCRLGFLLFLTYRVANQTSDICFISTPETAATLAQL